VVASSTGIAGRDSAGVVSCGMLLVTDSICWLVSLAESGVVSVFLALVALGGGILGEIFLDVAESVADGKGGSAMVFVVDCANQGNNQCGCCFVEAVLY
jgi:hypothetical protein